MGVLIIHNSHVIENGKTEMHRCISWTFDNKWTASVVSQGDELSRNEQSRDEWTRIMNIDSRNICSYHAQDTSQLRAK